MNRFRAVLAAGVSIGLVATAVAQQPAGVPQPVAAAAAAQQVRSGEYKLDQAHAKIVWSVSHFGFSTYYGEFTEFDAKLKLDSANPAASRLEATIDTASIDGHDEALEKHLRSADFFDTETHPGASFVSTQIRPTSATTADVTGNFTMLGVTKPLTLKVTFNKAGENMQGVYVAGFSAEGAVKRSDYGMTYGTPGLGDEVRLIISGEFNPAA